MLKYLFAALVMIATCSSVHAQSPSTQVPANNEPGNIDIVIGKILKIDSQYLNEERNISIRLPDSYNDDTSKSYPLLYVLDGGVKQDFIHIAGIAQLGELSGMFDTFIVVGIETKVRLKELTSPPTDPRYDEQLQKGGDSEKLRLFIEEEVKPRLSKDYRTNGKSALIGESLAGLFVMDVFLNHPTSFDDYIAISPSLWWNKQQLPSDAPTLLKKHDFSNKRLYLTMGNEDGTMRVGLDQMTKALREHAPTTLKWHFVDRKYEETHATIYHVAALDALRKLYGKAERTGVSTRYPWLHIGPPPPLSAMARASLEKPCTRENAIKTTFKTLNVDPNEWRGVCVLLDGKYIPDTETSKQQTTDR